MLKKRALSLVVFLTFFQWGTSSLHAEWRDAFINPEILTTIMGSAVALPLAIGSDRCFGIGAGAIAATGFAIAAGVHKILNKRNKKAEELVNMPFDELLDDELHFLAHYFHVGNRISQPDFEEFMRKFLSADGNGGLAKRLVRARLLLNKRVVRGSLWAALINLGVAAFSRYRLSRLYQRTEEEVALFNERVGQMGEQHAHAYQGLRNVRHGSALMQEANGYINMLKRSLRIAVPRRHLISVPDLSELDAQFPPGRSTLQSNKLELLRRLTRIRTLNHGDEQALRDSWNIRTGAEFWGDAWPQ